MEVPEKVLLIDCETTGVDFASDSLCEIGAILFSIKHRAVIQEISFLVPVEQNPAESINGIPPELTYCSEANRWGYAVLLDMFRDAGAIVAHNADFDRQWFELAFSRWGAAKEELDAKPWICTCHGISWGNVKQSPSLAALALAHGVPVWAAHRALTDCIYLAQIFERDELLLEHLAEGLLPQKLVRACVSFDQKDMARKAGFRWDPSRKQWTRKCNQKQIAALPFSAVEA